MFYFVFLFGAATQKELFCINSCLYIFKMLYIGKGFAAYVVQLPEP